MKTQQFTFQHAGHTITMRHIKEDDIEYLRIWKNKHKDSFFSRLEISIRMQQAWYQAYTFRLEDHMFIIFADDAAIGCLGCRFLEDHWDIYNVILGNTNFGGKGIMSSCLRYLIKFARANKPENVILKVLKSNPARTWYLRQDFSILHENEEFSTLILNSNML